MYQRFGLVSVTVSATCLLLELCPNAEHERDGDTDHLIRQQKEDRRRRGEHEHHRGGDPGFLARAPANLVRLLTHLLHELERVQLRHFVVSALPCLGPNRYAPPNLTRTTKQILFGSTLAAEVRHRAAWRCRLPNAGATRRQLAGETALLLPGARSGGTS